MILRKFILLFLVLTIVACEFTGDIRIEDDAPIGYPDVDQALWIYFDGFVKEAGDRGYNDMHAKLLELSGSIDNIPDDGVAGTCNYASHRPNHVTIDQDFWNNSSNLSREFIVFHELGHCALIRDHLDACNANKIYESIMRSGLGNCRDAYNTQNRDYYLNELYSIYGDWITS